MDPWEQAQSDLNELIKSYSLEVFKGVGDEIWVSFTEDSICKTLLLYSPQWKRWLFGNSFLMSPPVEKLVTSLLADMAEYESRRKVNVRVARVGKTVQVDLGNTKSEVVHISDSRKGFHIDQPNGAWFYRPTNQQSLPKPEACKREIFLKLFKDLIPNLETGSWLLVLAFVLKSLHRDNGSYVILIIEGPQGSGKSILSRRLKALIDPSTTVTRSVPRSMNEIAIAARNEHLLVFENVSGINGDVSDVFCRLATGAGYSKKKGYYEEVSYHLHNPVIINGINGPSNRPDFLERSVTLILKPIIQGERIPETELNDKFHENLPQLLGGIYSLLGECLQIISVISFTQEKLPRMTDYAIMGIAIERVLKLPSGYFLETYYENLNDQNHSTFWDDDLHPWITLGVTAAPIV